MTTWVPEAAPTTPAWSAGGSPTPETWIGTPQAAAIWIAQGVILLVATDGAFVQSADGALIVVLGG